MRIIKFSNYLKAVLLFIVTVMTVISLSNYYIKKQEFENNTNTRLKSLTYITEDSIKDYIVENHDLIIYVSDSKNKDLEEQELGFEQYIIENDLEKDIVYIDSSKLSDDFLYEFSNYNIVPNIFIIEEGVISKVLYLEVTTFQLNDVISFINNNWEE